MITKLLSSVTVGIAALAIGLAVGRFWPAPAPARGFTPPRSHGPTIEQVRELSSLVTLVAPVSDWYDAALDGYTGGVRVTVLIHGEAEVATDLAEAAFVEVDSEARRAVLVLPEPEIGRPRIDHDRSRIIDVRHSGLWRMLPGETGEKELTDRSLREAQRRLLEIVDEANVIARARKRAEHVLGQFFEALDWTVDIRWRES